jgi:hypothetical protein
MNVIHSQEEKKIKKELILMERPVMPPPGLGGNRMMPPPPNLRGMRMMPPPPPPGPPMMIPPVPLMIHTLDSKNFGKDENCGGYNLMNVCNFCYNSYFNPKTNLCTVPMKKVENCLFYLDEEYCLNCELGYQMNMKQRKCVKNSVKNCKNEIKGKCQVKSSLLLSLIFRFVYLENLRTGNV